MEQESKYSDRFGVPHRVLRLHDDFFGALGRVAALAAIVELRLSDLVVTWGNQQKDTGAPVKRLAGRFDEIVRERRAAGLTVRDEMVDAVVYAVAVLEERNELLHSLWPAEDLGWRNKRLGPLTTTHKGLADVQQVIGRLCAASDKLYDFLSSPID